MNNFLKIFLSFAVFLSTPLAAYAQVDFEKTFLILDKIKKTNFSGMGGADIALMDHGVELHLKDNLKFFELLKAGNAKINPANPNDLSLLEKDLGLSNTEVNQLISKAKNDNFNVTHDPKWNSPHLNEISISKRTLQEFLEGVQAARSKPLIPAGPNSACTIEEVLKNNNFSAGGKFDVPGTEISFVDNKTFFEMRFRGSRAPRAPIAPGDLFNGFWQPLASTLGLNDPSEIAGLQTAAFEGNQKFGSKFGNTGAETSMVISRSAFFDFVKKACDKVKLNGAAASAQNVNPAVAAKPAGHNCPPVGSHPAVVGQHGASNLNPNDLLSPEEVLVANSYYKQKYKDAPEDVDYWHDPITNKGYAVNRPSHALLHSIRKSALLKDIIDTYVKGGEGITAEYTKHVAAKDPLLSRKLQFAELLYRAGRQSEDINHDHDEEYFNNTAKIFETEAGKRPDLFSHKDITDIARVIRSQGNEDIKLENDEQRLYEDLLNAAHEFDVRRIPSFSGGKKLDPEVVKKEAARFLHLPNKDHEIIKKLWDRAGEYIRVTGDADYALNPSKGRTKDFYLLSHDPARALQVIREAHAKPL